MQQKDNIKSTGQEKQSKLLGINNLLNEPIRSVSRIIKSEATSDGEGVKLNRSFPNRFISELDPFLLLDEMGPTEIKPGNGKGFPHHPHRGFETVTYLLDGRFQHEDSQGHRGIINAGDVQWMTAGSGVIHSELPEKEFAKKGGKLHGFQLWVNLPKSDKMMKPRYQEISRLKIPTIRTKDGKVIVKIIAGESLGAKAVIDTIIPIIYLHFRLEPGSQMKQAVPTEFNAFAYIIKGNAIFTKTGNNIIKEGHLVIFENDGNEVYFQAGTESKEPLELLLIGGRPLREPVVRYGPFVMNTQQEIFQAIEDYRNGKIG